MIPQTIRIRKLSGLMVSICPQPRCLRPQAGQRIKSHLWAATLGVTQWG